MGHQTLRVLMIEDSADDAELILCPLKESGFEVYCLRVETIESLRDALNSENWDVILSDYNLPDFDAGEALTLLKEHDLDIPLIIVSGCIGEETAASLMKAGAHDFVMKGSPARLVPVVQRSLLEAENRRQFSLSQTALKKSEARFRAIASNLPGVMFQFMLEQQEKISFPYVSDGSLMLLGLHPSTLMDTPEIFSEMIIPQDWPSYCSSMTASANNLSPWNWEGRIRVDKETEVKWISLRATPRQTSSKATLWDGIVINITRNKLAEIEIASSREQLAELSSYLQKIKEQERARIAREIHDDIGGILTAIKCELLPWADGVSNKPVSYRKKAESIESLVDQVIDSTRRISMDLRPGILDCGIVAAVKWQAKEFCGRARLRYRVSCDSDEIPLDSELSVAIFRIFQETLTNISKHANASRLQIRLSEKDGWIFLEVTDNGCGISDQDITKPQSFGIRGMRERCQQLRGNLFITGKPGKGTKVSISIPENAMEMSSKKPIDKNITPTTLRPALATNHQILTRILQHTENLDYR